ncbi:unnamed protein product [Meganyctiphanes norvegica]|uniref:Short-chain dehydrogenase/reductase 3 n=1 Tax=Meganyctiphanes norvegica TaxID=48144 RepID=A0AAV2QFH0_MEGNR
MAGIVEQILSLATMAYQYVLLLLDICRLIFQTTILYITAIWHIFKPPPPKSVSGEIVLITGTGHGIGRELALQYSRLGAKVVCLDINEVNNNKTIGEIKREGGAAWGYKCDVSNREDVRAVSQKVRDEVGDVTVLVNNAGIMPCKPFLKHTPDEIERIFKINVFAHYWTLREWLPSFIASGHGHVVAVSSICGFMGTANLVPYCSSKFAIRGLMEGLVEEMRYGGRNTNIKFTTIHPFTIDTGLAQKPRIRFPVLNPITTPAHCAEAIIDGMRRDYETVCVPTRDYYLHIFTGILPNSVRKVFLDFMDTGVDEHDT